MTRKKRPTSKAWIKRHVNDYHVRQSRTQDYRSRSAFKLEQLDGRDRIVKPGDRIVDLGAAPGGWCQYLSRKPGSPGLVIGVDLLEIQPIENVLLVKGDIFDEETIVRVLKLLDDTPADLVLSDMAANISGIAGVDQARMESLFDSVLGFCRLALKAGGKLVFKSFEGSSSDYLRNNAALHFGRVHNRKPAASRQESREFYLVCLDYRSAGA